MRISILTVGSYGDIRPYLALARGLNASGHDARLLGPDQYARFVEPAGVHFEGLGPYYDQEETLRVLAGMAAEPNPRRHPGIALAISQQSALGMGPAAIELTRDADLVIAHAFGVIGYVAAHVNHKPLITGQLFPALASSRYGVTGRNYGVVCNRLLWSLAARGVAASSDPLYAEVLARFGLPMRRNFFLQGGHSALCNLIAVSPRVVPRDPDWPPHYEMTGYWDLPEPAFEPDPELASFVRAGPPPIVISFGSMVGVDVAQLTNLLVRAVAASGRRAVLQAGWAGLGSGLISRDVLAVDYVPHVASVHVSCGSAATVQVSRRTLGAPGRTRLETD